MRVCVIAFLFGSRGCKYRCEWVSQGGFLHNICMYGRKMCVKCVCSCGEQGSGPCRPRPPSVNWKRRLLSQRQGSNQRPVSETKRDFIGANLNHRRLKSSLFVKII